MLWGVEVMGSSWQRKSMGLSVMEFSVLWNSQAPLSWGFIQGIMIVGWSVGVILGVGF